MLWIRTDRGVVERSTGLGPCFVNGGKTMRTRVSSGVTTDPDRDGGLAVQSEPTTTDKAVFKVPLHGVNPSMLTQSQVG